MGTNRPDIYIYPGTTTGVTVPEVAGVDYYYTTAVHDGVTDAQPQIMADFAFCMLNRIPELRFHSGVYHINSPIFLSNVSGGIYNGFTIKLQGEANMWGDDGTFISAGFKDSFLLGIQRGKGVRVDGFHFRGLFTPPTYTTSQAFYDMAFADFTDPTCRDSRYSPYAALVIDPFTNGAPPTDGGYPGMSSYYFGNGSQNGSTSTIITNCQFESVVVGICSCPNGQTRNGENTWIQNVQFKFNKLCLSGGQDQEKNNRMTNFSCWYNSHTIFANGGVYGAGGAGDWTIDGGNIAGRVNTFIQSRADGWFPVTIKNIYAESLGKWGSISNTSTTMSKVENCKIDFATPNEAGIQSPLITGAGNVVYDGCVFRYYGQTTPLPIAGNITFQNTHFSGFPMMVANYVYPRYINCTANKIHLGLMGNYIPTSGDVFHPYGDFTITTFGSGDFDIQHGGSISGVHYVTRTKSYEVYTSFTTDSNVSLTITNGSTTFTSADSNGYALQGIVRLGAYFGVVTTISGSSVTISYLPLGADPVSSYNITAYHAIYLTNIIGDITAGNNQILNCGGNLNLVGYVIKNPYGGSQFLKVLSVVGSTITVYGSISATKTGAIFSNYTSGEVYTEYPNNNAFGGGVFLRKGDKVIEQKGSENSIEHIVVKGGFLSGADSRKAILAQTSGTWTGTQAQYDAIVNPSDDIIYYITNTAP